jgi:hypothetical protein
LLRLISANHAAAGVPALHTIYGRVAEFEREMPRYLSQL